MRVLNDRSSRWKGSFLLRDGFDVGLLRREEGRGMSVVCRHDCREDSKCDRELEKVAKGKGMVVSQAKQEVVRNLC